MVPSDSAVIAACNSALPQPMACSRGMTMELKLYSSNELELVATPIRARISTCHPRLNSALSKPFMGVTSVVADKHSRLRALAQHMGTTCRTGCIRALGEDVFGMDQRRAIAQFLKRQERQVFSLGQGHGQSVGNVQLDHGITHGRCVDGADEQVEHIHATVFPLGP